MLRRFVNQCRYLAVAVVAIFAAYASGLASAVGNGTARITAAIGAVAGTATVTVGQVATQLAFMVEPENAMANEAMTPALQIGVLDAGGNPVVGATNAITVATDGVLRCWGDNSSGQLGYGHTDRIGDDETPADAGDVPVGAPVAHVDMSQHHTCVVLTTFTARCWGSGSQGQLGYGNTNTIGNDETPASVGDVPVGNTVTGIGAGGITSHSCAVLSTGAVRCWGDNGVGLFALTATLRV